MLRPTLPDDTPTLLKIARETGVFKPHEIVALGEVLDDYHKVNHEYGHRAQTWDEDGPAGFVYYAPTAMTDRTWELWWIVVDRSRQGRGLGGKLLRAVEDEVRSRTGRVLLIETSSLPHYDPTRRFYVKNGYGVAAVVPDFYSDGDSKVIFSKRMSG